MSYPVYFVNAFAAGLTYGNTAAVVIVESFPDAVRMQALASEFGFSETAFVAKFSAEKYHIRWFTPEVEVALCGHATLASAKVLFCKGYAEGAELSFASMSGELICHRKGDKIELNFPVDTPQSAEVNDEVPRALGSESPMEVLYAPATCNLLLVYNHAESIKKMQPDFSALSRHKDDKWFGIAVTAPSQGSDDYICRYFAPWEGINEDPVTGSAQTFLAPYWAEKQGKKVLNGYQASARGGRFEVELCGQRVLIRGEAYIFMEGQVSGI